MTDRSRSIARLQFLGGQRIEIGSDVVTPEAERLFAMVVRLCVPLGRLVSRQTVMDTLWPGADEANARHNLRQTVYKARELGLVVESGEDGLRLDPHQWSCDWEDPVGDVPGEWLPNYDPLFSDDLRGWVTAQRIGVHASLRPRIVRCLQRARAAGELTAADAYARQLLSIDELNEEATLTRAELMAMQGSKVDALRLLDAYSKEIGTLSSGREAGLPAAMLRRRIAEKLPTTKYQTGQPHSGALVGRPDIAKHLFACTIAARASRGTATLLLGLPGAGKSRLLQEARNAAILQGMLVVAYSCTSEASSVHENTAKRIAMSLLECPGSLGVAPEALDRLRAWLPADSTEQTACPIDDLNDLFASVSEECPLAILVDNCEHLDEASLRILDSVYVRGQERQHMAVLSAGLPLACSSVLDSITSIDVLPLPAMPTDDILTIITSYATENSLKVDDTAMRCAAVFSEGIPMFGIEMYGLLLDVGSPDVIPWRVQNALDASIGCMSDLQLRILALCGALEARAHQDVLTGALETETAQISPELDRLERIGHIRFEDGRIRASNLLSMFAPRRLRANTVRMDAFRAARALSQAWSRSSSATEFYAIVRLYIAAKEEALAMRFIDAHAGDVVRTETAHSLIFELARLKRAATSSALSGILETMLSQVAVGSDNRRALSRTGGASAMPSSLPPLSDACVEFEYSFSSDATLNRALTAARDPNAPPAQRITDAVMALAIASNTGETECLISAYQAATAVRSSTDVSPFDAARADVIYFATTGERERAMQSAQSLGEACRALPDIHLACKGLRNAAEVFSTFGELDAARAFLHESRTLAARLEYSKQIAWSDIRLADLSVECMDLASAQQYLASAQSVVDRYALTTPLLLVDLYVQLCWEATVRGDIASASKAARQVLKRMQRSYSGPGTAQWTAVSVRLATFSGSFTKETARGFGMLRASIGSRPYYPNEHVSMAALLLASRKARIHPETCDFISAQIPRYEASGRKMWRYLYSLM